MAANEGSSYTNFSNLSVGTSSGGGAIKVKGNNVNFGVTVVTAAKTVAASESGETFVLRAAAGAAITLPTMAAGLKYKFIIGSAFATTDWTVTTTDTDTIYGTLSVNGADVEAAATDVVTFVATAETIGDYVEFVCDGVYWYINGFAAAVGGITSTG